MSTAVGQQRPQPAAGGNSDMAVRTVPSYNMSLLPHLYRVVGREDLSAAEAEQAMSLILAGEISIGQITAFITALRMKGETATELVGFARAMREKSLHVTVDLNGEPLLDTCGTGGDGYGTFNISTVAAFVLAGAGVRIAKHGNRSISSRCGSADVLEHLGVRVALDADQAARAIREVGIGFLFAPAFHPAMKHAQPARVELKMRTVFNLLGPLTNPARATAQLVGAPSVDAAGLIAQALAELGLQRGFVVHGSDGLDEITTTGPTAIFEIEHGAVSRREIVPADFGVSAAELAELKGGTAEQNAVIARAILQGEPGAKRDIVLVNSAAAMVAASRAQNFREGMLKAAESLDSGAALHKLEQLAKFTETVA